MNLKLFKIGLLAVVSILLLVQSSATVKKALGMSFINPINGYFELIYKGKNIALISRRNCAITYFNNKEFPKPIFDNELQVSKDYENIRYINHEDFTIWKNGINIQDTQLDFMRKTIKKFEKNHIEKENQ